MALISGQASSGTMGRTTCRPLPPVVLTHDSRLQDSSAAARTSAERPPRARGPGERLVGVEVDDEAVRALQAIWMLGAAGKSSPRGGPPARTFARARRRLRGYARETYCSTTPVFLSGTLDRIEAVRQRACHVLLVKRWLADALGNTHQRQRPAGDVWQHPVRHCPVEVGELLLGQR